METSICRLKEQGFSAGSCAVEADGKRRLACQATLKYENGNSYRLITSIHLSRPENYLSIYQAGCNFSCRKCHSWTFSKIKDGEMKDVASPNVAQMVDAYQRVKAVGMTNVRLGNVGVFARTTEDQAYLMENVDPAAY